MPLVGLVHNNCRFLEVDRIDNEEDAVTWSINAAVQRNNVYSSDSGRERFRDEWKKELRKESQRQGAASVSDFEHCTVIRGIADRLSAQFAHVLNGGRLRFGTSQKAFNLYLKYLWHLGEITAPPHCPFDAVVLGTLSIYDLWTRSDDEKAYMRWVSAARIKAGTVSIPQWECAAWLNGVSKFPSSRVERRLSMPDKEKLTDEEWSKEMEEGYVKNLNESVLRREAEVTPSEQRKRAPAVSSPPPRLK